jgi:aspartyl-tRNA(Asn)/glutamyl-tRNA(Gln) amidotransferase subunit C
MKVSDDMVVKLASLARLRFTESEKQAIKTDLDKMIQFVDKLNELDTSGIAPLIHLSSGENIFREDIEKSGCSREDALKNALVRDELFFKVPKVITK